MGLEIVGNHDGNSSSLLGTSYSGMYLLTEHISGAPRSNTAIEPAITPVHQAKTIHFPNSSTFLPHKPRHGGLPIRAGTMADRLLKPSESLEIDSRYEGMGAKALSMRRQQTCGTCSLCDLITGENMKHFLNISKVSGIVRVQAENAEEAMMLHARVEASRS